MADEQDDAEGRGTNEKILDGSSPRQRLVEQQVEEYCQRAGAEQLDKEMRDEGVKAIKIATNKFAYKKKYYDSANDKMIVFPSVASCLVGFDVYEEAEKYYYDPEDEYPLKYTAALRDLSLQAGGADEDVEHMEAMGMDCESDDEFFKKEAPPAVAEDDDAGRGSTEKVLGEGPRQRLIEKEIDQYCKRAGEEQLDKEMRDEGVKALKIGANKYAYKKRYYDSANDKMIVYPSVAGCLAGHDVYEEAEKYYYDPEDEYPLKYTAALRDLALENGGGDEDTDHMDTMAMDCASDDEFFGGPSETTAAEPVEESTPAAPAVLGSSPRQRLIEAELDIFCTRAGQEQLDKEMREEGIIAVKIATNLYAYKKKFYDSATDKLIIFPSVASCLVGYDVYEEAEKHYYDPGDDYPLKYIAALRDLSLEAGGADADVDHMGSMAMDCDSDDEFFEKQLQTL